MSSATAVLGTGSASAGDRIAPALDLARSGRLQYQVFDRLGGPAVAHLELSRQVDPSTGHDPNTRDIAKRFCAAVQAGTRLIGNFGAANVATGVSAAVDGLRAADGQGVRVAGIHGDNVRDLLIANDVALPGLGIRSRALGDDLLTAHAYIGAELITEALRDGAGIVMGGRICDASLAVGALCHELGWEYDDWDALAIGTLTGHLLTGGAGPLGGGFADPPYRVVPGIGNLGFPIATVDRDSITISKLPQAGGLISPETLKCRISYEIADPAAYLTPDVSASFIMAEVVQVADNEVRITGITGAQRPDDLLVLVTVDRGWISVAEISFGGIGCLDRARLGEEMAREALADLGPDLLDCRFEYSGWNSLDSPPKAPDGLADVHLRISARSRTKDVAQEAAAMSGRLYWGPAGGAAMANSVRRAIESTDAFVPRSAVWLESEVVVA